jgi:beta-aspartyl-peptidase (threonine type)
MPSRALIVHGGAGSGRFSEDDRRFAELRAAVDQGLAAMKRGSSVDGVEAAVRYMEDCGEFNAGRGSCLTAEGTVQLDAAIMEGTELRGAGVGVCECTYNPVALARAIMEKTDHVLIAGRDCLRYAKAEGLAASRLRPSPRAKERYAAMRAAMKGRNLDMLRSMEEGNTVGAVAVDSDGVPAAAVSTGGMWMKLPGRVGDSAILGAGLYADLSSGAACATGMGEDIIRCALCWNACEFLKKADATTAARRSIALVGRVSGRKTAGIITVDLEGRVGSALNTEAMGRAWYDQARGRVVVKV